MTEEVWNKNLINVNILLNTTEFQLNLGLFMLLCTFLYQGHSSWSCNVKNEEGSKVVVIGSHLN